MKKVNVGFGEYFKPTPKNIRKYGDALLAIAGIGLILAPGAKWVAIIGISGKFISNFFSDK